VAEPLHDIVADRAKNARQSVRHATGVYFPNRTHSARIAMKKFRYSLEIADATRSVPAADAIRDLKKTPDILGDLHDRQAFDRPARRQRVVRQAQRAHHSRDAGVDAEIHALHARYLARRERVMTIARQVRLAKGGLTVPAPVIVAAGVLGVSSGLFVARRQIINGIDLLERPGLTARRSASDRRNTG
jgi:CHAD domain-containing protein